MEPTPDSWTHGAWTQVRWNEAGQLAPALGWTTLDPQEAALPPQAFVARLSGEGRLAEAVQFLGQALPRLEAVAWAARLTRDLPRTGRMGGDAEAAALRAALLWLQDPSEGRRRAARIAGDAAGPTSAERFAALAAFYSGGSLAPDGLQPAPAPKTVTGRLASAAVLLAAHACAEPQAALRLSVEAGARLAAGEDRVGLAS